MKLLLISSKSDTPSGGVAVWSDHFLSHCETQHIQCRLVNTKILGKRATTTKRNICTELFRTIRIFHSLRKELKANSFDAVYLNTSCGTYGLFRDAMLGRYVHKKKIPLITHYHCEIPYWVKRKASIRCLGKLAGISHHNLVLCRNSEEFLKDRYHVSVEKVPNFVDTSIVRKENKPINPTIKNVFFVGRVTEAKGAKELFDVARRLPDVSFTFAGNVDKVVKRWDKPANVQLLGQIPHKEVLHHLDRADLFLFPSHTEGCSIALIECLARGVPAIASDVGANADLLSEQCGVIVPFDNVDAIIQSISRLQEPTLREAISKNAVQRILMDYTNNNLNIIVRILNELPPTTTEGRKPFMRKLHIRYLISRLLCRRPCAIKESHIDKKASVGNGTRLVNSRLGRYTYAYNCTIIHTDIGAYCSIAGSTLIGGGNHPIGWVSTSPVFYQPKNVLKTNFACTPIQEYEHTTIGNDVWIGSRCAIKGGVTIGDGAIIGMGSVVTKDVPPYEIWAGNPAKCIRKRFDDETIAKLLELKWWNWNEEKLHKYGKYFNDPQQLFEKLEEDQ